MSKESGTREIDLPMEYTKSISHNHYGRICGHNTYTLYYTNRTEVNCVSCGPILTTTKYVLGPLQLESTNEKN
jgi:hypothetical protein